MDRPGFQPGPHPCRGCVLALTLSAHRNWSARPELHRRSPRWQRGVLAAGLRAHNRRQGRPVVKRYGFQRAGGSPRSRSGISAASTRRSSVGLATLGAGADSNRTAAFTARHAALTPTCTWLAWRLHAHLRQRGPRTGVPACAWRRSSLRRWTPACGRTGPVIGTALGRGFSVESNMDVAVHRTGFLACSLSHGS